MRLLGNLWTARHLGGGKLRIAVALVMVVSASVFFWVSRDYTVSAPEWDGQVRGIAYNPSHVFTQRQNMSVAPARIDRDLTQLSKLTSHLRTYTVDNGMDRVPAIARHHGMTVSMGIWISADLDKNEEQIALGIRTALANRRTIDRVIVGNETQTFGYVSPDQLNGYIRQVRAALPARIKVTTAEPWSTWMMTPASGCRRSTEIVTSAPNGGRAGYAGGSPAAMTCQTEKNGMSKSAGNWAPSPSPTARRRASASRRSTGRTFLFRSRTPVRRRRRGAARSGA